MAYISQSEKATLLPEIKRVLKKYGMKGSVSIRHHMTLVVTLPEGSLDLIGNWYEMARNDRGRAYPVGDKPTYLNVSHHWLDSRFSGDCLAFLSELFEAMRGPDWFDDSDLMTDYFHVAHYVDVNVGRWNRPYLNI